MVERIPEAEELTGFSLRRRTFLQVLGSGILIGVLEPAEAQPESAVRPVSARIYLNRDGTITALSGKVEEGQGPRAELTQAAAEELRVPVERVRLVMSDTDLVPDDGITAGSRTTPRNVPEMRQAAATARTLLAAMAARRWQVDADHLEVQNGVVRHPQTGRSLSYADLAAFPDLDEVFRTAVRTDLELTPPDHWQVLGRSIRRPNDRDLVTGAHRFASDIVRPGMLYGRVLRPPSFGAELEAVDLAPAERMDGVVVVREGSFVGVAAPNSHLAGKALAAIQATAEWKQVPQPVSNRNLVEHLQRTAGPRQWRGATGEASPPDPSDIVRTLEATYDLAYIAHAPMEPRAAVAEWQDGRLTVWAGCDGPFRARQILAEELGVPPEHIRVIVPDLGGGFGGKHTAEAAVEAARLARGARRPVHVRWTREEEFTWAYLRPAAVVECRAALGRHGRLLSWEFTNINGGGAAVDTPYDVPYRRIASPGAESPLRQGSYRCLGATGSNFARESFMDELALAAAMDPLEFRLAHLGNQRLRAVLETAAERFGWASRRRHSVSGRGVGLACGTEKNSVVAACVEVEVDRQTGRIQVLEICEAFECGAILNPGNLLSQVQGCILMALGGALWEEIRFENGRILNPRFSEYRVPRFADVPRLEVHLVDRRDLPSAGGGETPIIALAPAIGNAVFAAAGVRLRSLPLRLPPVT